MYRWLPQRKIGLDCENIVTHCMDLETLEVLKENVSQRMPVEYVGVSIKDSTLLT